jgi:ABC-2 type transport system ATP-binding protein
MTIETMIRVSGLHFGYKSGKPLFSDLDLQLQGGQIYGLLGRNGAGKTTLLRLIAGLLRPRAGEVVTLGYPAFQRHAQMLADICFIPEEWAVPDMDLRDLPRIYGPFYPNFDERLFWKLVEEFELPAAGKLTGSSFGQKKKAIISFGLATRARLLILDEPTNGLDIPSKSKFRKIISSSLHDETCMIISTHQVRDMVNLIDPLIILDQGRIIFQQDLATVAEKLVFRVHTGLQEPSDTLYAERIPGGYLTVAENHNGEDSDVDLEVLFNTIIQHPDKIRALFNH